MAMGVGAFASNDRRTIRSVPNVLDKSTIVSIYPKRINERKETIEPGQFAIEPGTYDNPSVLVIGTSSWWLERDPEQPLIEIPMSSVTIADSIIKDWANGLFMCDMDAAMPGVFFVEGNYTALEIKMRHRERLDFYANKQRNWFNNLVKAADTLWARSQGNPLAISDDMRLAARELNLNDKPWIKDFTTITMVSCPACGSMVKPGFPICANCKTIVNKAQYDEMQLVQAK